MTNFGIAGPHMSPVGKDGQFQRTILIPWEITFEVEPPLISLIAELAQEFTVMDATTFRDGLHEALFIDNRNGKQFQIKINGTRMKVYPKSEDHQDSSEKILKIAQDVAMRDVKIITFLKVEQNHLK